MSYQVLARKWRPHTFSEMVGQEHVLKALVHALDQQRLHHAYLFTGTRGVGKTTLGRILARCLNCDQGISSTPCGQCDSCRELLEGRFVDLIEIDAASRTKVEDMRELLDNVQYSPTRGRFKIYLIDEVHMLSNSSFNALLKTLEEPPDHVKFLFATTDPQKLPVTVLSRCLQFNLKRMTPNRIVDHLTAVLGEEHIEFEQPALWLLARAADGSMRDALSLTDQAIAYGEQKLVAGEVAAMLGTVGQNHIEAILRALVARNGQAVLAEVSSLAEFSPDYSAVLGDLLAFLHRITLEQTVPGSTDDGLGDREVVRELAGALSAEDAQLFYQTALTGRRDLEITPDARMGFEMTLLRMLAFAPEPPEKPGSSVLADADQAVGGELQRESGEASISPAPAVNTAEENAEPEPVAAGTGQPQGHVEGAASGAVAEQASDGVPAHLQETVPVDCYDGPEASVSNDTQATSVARNADEEQVEPEAPSQPGKPESQEASAMASADAGPHDDDGEVGEGSFSWVRDFDDLQLGGMTRTLAAVGSLQTGSGGFVLTVDEGHSRLLNERHRERIQQSLSDRLGHPVVLEIRVGEPGDRTPARWQEQRREAQQAAAVASIHSDPNVAAIVKAFDGHIVEDSIEPRGSVRKTAAKPESTR